MRQDPIDHRRDRRRMADAAVRWAWARGVSARWVSAGGLAVALMLPAPAASAAGATAPVGIAVFDFVLDDRSAAGGVVEADPIDAENLAASTAEARRRLTESGRFRIIDTADVADDMEAAGGVQHCDGCEAALARQIGADQSMVGVITRVSRTEFTLQIVVRDAASGEVVSNSFTGLRMGANYAWPRGVKWLMTNQILKADGAE